MQANKITFLLLRLERVMGIEPTQSAWKAEVLPLNYTRLVTAVDWLNFRLSGHRPANLPHVSPAITTREH